MPYWRGDREQVLTLAKRLADIEDKPRTDVMIEFVLRFDAEEPLPATIAYIAEKFKVRLYRCTRRGEHHPGGPNDQFFDYLGKNWERCLRDPKYKETVDGIYLYEGDNVPLRKDWLDAILAEWKTAREQGKYVLGCWHPDGSPVGHINGNLIYRPDLYGLIPDLNGCPSFFAWDLFIAPKLEPHWYKSSLMVNLYKATNVPKSWVYDKKGKAKYATCHGVKCDSVWKHAIEMLQNV